MKRWLRVLLLFELFLFALILVLPQVDLPDTAFRDGNTPLALRFGSNMNPVVDCTLSGCIKSVQHASRSVVGESGWLVLRLISVPARGDVLSPLLC